MILEFLGWFIRLAGVVIIVAFGIVAVLTVADVLHYLRSPYCEQCGHRHD